MNRFQRVVLPGGKSEWLEIKAGVPQGSILGPLLFLLYINDNVYEIHSNIRLFADETTLYIIADFPDSAAQILNVDLHRISNWADLWLVDFNANKAEAFLASRRTNRINHVSYRGERGGSVVECRTPEREVGGSIPTAAVLCP